MSKDRVPQLVAGRRRRCPACGKPTEMRYRPFCSARCRDLDLGRWLDGAYAVPAVEIDEDEEISVEPDQRQRD